MPSKQKRSKQYGYETEVAALDALKEMFPNLRRTGSMAYKKAAADLVQTGSEYTEWEPLRLVVTRDKRRPLLVTMSVEDLTALVYDRAPDELPVVVQVKAREKTWVGRLWSELKAATK